MKKRGPPNHVQKPHFIHPSSSMPLIHIFEKVPDPRGPSPNFSYSMTSILFITLIATLCGADDWEEIAVIAEELQDWIAQFVDLSHGIPSLYTLERVISLIEPKALETMLREITVLIKSHLTNDVIAIDGKTLCGSADKSNKQRGVHLLHAWSCENRICLAQAKVDDKSNEITAICGLMDQLLLKDNIITTDALNTQKAVAEKAIEKEGHYILPVKDNHPGLLSSIELLFTDAESRQFNGIDSDTFESLDKSRGRVEERICTVLDASELIESKEWRGLQSAAKIVRRRSEGGKTSEETTYYISDLEIDGEKIAQAIRAHWCVENHLHYSLDVVLGEDSHTYRNRNGACNLAIIRKLVLTALEKTQTKKKRSKKTKRLLAAVDPGFRMSCLHSLF